ECGYVAGPDADADNAPDTVDNCVSTFNPVQGDADDDGTGDSRDAPAVEVPPTTGLQDGQSVTVSSGGGQGETTAYVLVCPASVIPANAAQVCANNYQLLDVSAGFVTSITVSATSTSFSAGPFTCDQSPGECVI